jgi:hypothetical protein
MGDGYGHRHRPEPVAVFATMPATCPILGRLGAIA